MHAGINSKLEAAVLNSAQRFENGVPGDRFRLVLSELLYVQLWVRFSTCASWVKYIHYFPGHDYGLATIES